MIDNKIFEKQEKSAVKLTVTVSASGVKEIYDSLLGKYGKQAQIPGFRKGKVPEAILTRKFGDAIKGETAEKLVETSLKESFGGDNEEPISRPLLKELPAITLGESYDFTVTYDVFPQITLGDYKNIEVEEPQVSLLEKHEDEALEVIRNRHALIVEKPDGVIADKTVVGMHHVELDDKDQPIEKTRHKNFVFTLGEEPHPYNIEEEILDLKVGDSKIIEKNYPKEGNSPPLLAGRSAKIEVKILSVKKRELPKIDDELAQDIDAEFKTLADLKKKIHSDLEENASKKIRGIKIKSLTETLLETSLCDVPQSMLDAELENTWKDYIHRSGAKEEDLVKALHNDGRSKEDILKSWHDDAEKAVRIQLIMGKIIETEKIELSDKELTQEMEERAKTYKTSVENLEKMFGGQHYKTYLKNELIQEKLYTFLLDSLSIQKGEELDYTDLMST